MPAKYAYNAPDPGKSARAILYGSNISYKDACQVCSAVRGRNTERAIEFLSLAAVGKKAIWFRNHNAGKGHRRELGGKKGGWPVKSAKVILGVVQSALGNAGKKGLAPTKIAHISANKQDVLPRMSPKGKRMRMDYETAVIQVVLQEMKIPEHQRAGLAAKKAAGQKAAAATKTATPKNGQKQAATNALATETASEEKKQEVKAEKKGEQEAQKLAQKAENAAQRTAVHSSTHDGKKPAV